MKKTQPVICLFGSYDETILSSKVILNGLSHVYPKELLKVAHVQIPKGVVYSPSHVSPIQIIKRVYYRVAAQEKLLGFFYTVLQSDVLVVLPFGLLDLMQASVYKKIFGKKVVYIPQNSLYDLFMYATGKTKDTSISCRFVYHLERFLMSRADLVIFNSTQEALDHKVLLNLPTLHTDVLPLGADDSIFKPDTHVRKDHDDVFRVLFYGEYNEGQGVDVIVKAIARLKKLPIQFELVGDGRVKPHIVKMVKELKLEKNIQFTGWLSPAELLQKIYDADITLGMFGDYPVSRRAVPNKVYQGLATASTVVTGNSPAAREFMTHKKHAYLVELNNDEALADGIVDLYNHPHLLKKLRKQGHELFMNEFAPDPDANKLINIVKGIV